jgi:thiamine pyrophosphokinase
MRVADKARVRPIGGKMDKTLKDMTDLELAKLQGNMYQQLMMTQQNLIALNQEIDRRTPKEKPDNPIGA